MFYAYFFSLYQASIYHSQVTQLEGELSSFRNKCTDAELQVFDTHYFNVVFSIVQKQTFLFYCIYRVHIGQVNNGKSRNL